MEFCSIGAWGTEPKSTRALAGPKTKNPHPGRMRAKQTWNRKQNYSSSVGGFFLREYALSDLCTLFGGTVFIPAAIMAARRAALSILWSCSFVILVGAFLFLFAMCQIQNRDLESYEIKSSQCS